MTENYTFNYNASDNCESNDIEVLHAVSNWEKYEMKEVGWIEKSDDNNFFKLHHFTFKCRRQFSINQNDY